MLSLFALTCSQIFLFHSSLPGPRFLCEAVVFGDLIQATNTAPTVLGNALQDVLPCESYAVYINPHIPQKLKNCWLLICCRSDPWKSPVPEQAGMCQLTPGRVAFCYTPSFLSAEPGYGPGRLTQGNVCLLFKWCKGNLHSEQVHSYWRGIV